MSRAAFLLLWIDRKTLAVDHAGIYSEDHRHITHTHNTQAVLLDQSTGVDYQDASDKLRERVDSDPSFDWIRGKL